MQTNRDRCLAAFSQTTCAFKHKKVSLNWPRNMIVVRPYNFTIPSPAHPAPEVMVGSICSAEVVRGHYPCCIAEP